MRVGSLSRNQPVRARRVEGARDGFARGFIYAIAQTPDGYLWRGTEFGLLRFDGVRTVAWTPPGGQQLPSNDVPKLLVTIEGTL